MNIGKREVGDGGIKRMNKSRNNKEDGEGKEIRKDWWNWSWIGNK